jgi:hypothetical protein
VSREVLPTQRSATDGVNQAVRDADGSTLRGMGGIIVKAPGVPSEPRSSGNATLLLAGEHGGFTLAKPVGVLRGVPGTLVTKAARFESSARVSEIEFTAAVVLTATASVTFHNCRFLLPIEVANGGVISCHGCTFDGTAAITHAGPAGNANRYGCVGDSLLAADGPNVTIWGGL